MSKTGSERAKGVARRSRIIILPSFVNNTLSAHDVSGITSSHKTLRTQASWPWNSDIRQMRWRERTQRWVETATATEKSAYTIVKYRPGYVFFLNTWNEEGGGGDWVKNRLDYRARAAGFQVRGPLDSSVWGSWEGGREWYESFSLSWYLPVFMQRLHLMHVMKT